MLGNTRKKLPITSMKRVICTLFERSSNMLTRRCMLTLNIDKFWKMSAGSLHTQKFSENGAKGDHVFLVTF